MAIQAIPIDGPVMTHPSRALVRVVPEAQLQQSELLAEQAAAQQQQPAAMSDLAGFILTQYEIMSNHRNGGSGGWGDRLMSALRVFNGRYDAEKLSAIKRFGGSDVYARLVAMKCRGASSLLRDVYLTQDRPWGIGPPADPDIPENVVMAIRQLVQVEVATLTRMGQQIDPSMIRARLMTLTEEARKAEKKQSAKRAKIAEDKIDEILTEGGFYLAVAEMLVDIPLFPFGCLKGPIVRIVPEVTWAGNKPTISQTPKMFWYRVSPFDLYWTPGVSNIEDGAVIERSRLTRGELNDLLDLPGYNYTEVRAVLDEYGRGGLYDNWDTTDSERAVMENRENPMTNRSGMINCLEFHGNVQGRMLLDYGLGGDVVQDPLRDYMVQAWLIGRHVIKVQMTPSPRRRHPYYISSFEKVPGTPVGNALPDILSDIQDVTNATLRALVNNLSIASGPQVVVNDDRLAPGENGEDMYPWKRWHVNSDPLGNSTQQAISFFHPNSYAQELLTVYKEFNNIADDLSAIPKYLSGQGASGGAGRTASGLAMLMGNANKILQTVAANIDRDIFQPLLTSLLDMIMLTDQTGLLSGGESVTVKGVNVAIQRETQRARQLEFLQITANPMDSGIMGMPGRATVLRSVSETIGLDGEKIVPSDEEIQQKQAAALQMTQAGAAGAAQGQQAPQGGNVTQDMGPRTNIAGGVG